MSVENIEQVVMNFEGLIHRLNMLLDPGYGGVAPRLIEILENMNEGVVSMKKAEAQIIALQIKVKGIEVVAKGMVLRDEYLLDNCKGTGCYSDDAYTDIANELESISNRIEELAKEL